MSDGVGAEKLPWQCSYWIPSGNSIPKQFGPVGQSEDTVLTSMSSDSINHTKELILGLENNPLDRQG